MKTSLTHLVVSGVVVVVVVACGSGGESTFTGVTVGDGNDASAAGPDSSLLSGLVDARTDGGGGTGGPCKPKTCGDLGIGCGPAGDGCGGVVQCGTCTAPQTCGGGGPSKCGGQAACTPKTCTDLGANCGSQGDGCGGIIQCGTCSGSEFCGGGGANKCGLGAGVVDGGSCVPKSCGDLGKNCGFVSDGCGNVNQCGLTCPAGQICGGGGVDNVCGNPFDGGAACVPKTCADYPIGTCGPQADGCGGLTTNCNTCTSPEYCGGGGLSICGIGDAGLGPDACTGLCAQQVACDSGTTTVTGKVWAPNYGLGTSANHMPIYGALVYVPNAPLDPLPEGYAASTCDTCTAMATGAPLVRATTGADGSFILSNVPVGSNIPLVVQLGRWRRQITIAEVNPCTNNPLADGVVRLPRNRHEGNIPLTAISTGDVDGLECVLRKMGVDDCEFTSGTANGSNGNCGNGQPFSGSAGRVRIYRDDGALPPGGGSPPGTSTLTGSQTELDKFDQVLFACVGGESNKSLSRRTRVVNYADKGGRVFMTHYAYVWAYPSDLPWSNVGDWEREDGSYDNAEAYRIDTGTTKRASFAQWLVGVGISSAGNATPTVSIVESRNDLSGPIASGAERWLYAPPNTVQGDTDEIVVHATWNTPWGAQPSAQCGRAIYSDFHVTTGDTSGTTFPSECNSNPLTDQEKILAFMLFDLASCVQTSGGGGGGSCTPKTCVELGAGCGLHGDGCGSTVDCGNCNNGASGTCGGGGIANQCGSLSCTPKTCLSQSYNCGLAGDGCGGQLDCGPCTQPGQTCGGSGSANVCGTASCAPKSCVQLGATCGPIGDGCGNLLQCGTCPQGQACVNNQCVPGGCTPLSCQAQGIDCGPAGDGCGNPIDCGTCPNGQTCGGGGTPYKCGAPSGSPK